MNHATHDSQLYRVIGNAVIPGELVRRITICTRTEGITINMTRYLIAEYTKTILFHGGFLLLCFIIDKRTSFKSRLLSSFNNSELVFIVTFLAFVAASIFFLDLQLPIRASIFAFLFYMICCLPAS